MANLKLVPPPSTLAVSTSGNIMDDVYNAFSIHVSSLANRRPIWTINMTVDQISFYIGALGGISMGYLFDQYELPNINNIEYFNQQNEDRNIFMDVLAHIITSPFHIIHRFFVSGSLYVIIGLSTSRMIKQDGWGRPLVCGSLLGAYFTYGSPFTQTLKGVIGCSAFSLLMEACFALTMR